MNVNAGNKADGVLHLWWLCVCVGGIRLEKEREVKCTLHRHVFLLLCVAAMHVMHPVTLPLVNGLPRYHGYVAREGS